MRKKSVAEAANQDEHIFGEAVRLFREKGYHATSMQNIADAVGLQKGSLYHYISSKDELLFRIFERSTGAMTRELETILASKTTSTEKLHRAIELQITSLCEQLDIYAVYLAERRALANRRYAQVRAEAEEHARLLEKIIQQGITAGEFHTTDVKLTALAILGMCNWLYQWYSPDGRLTPQQIAAMFSDTIINGLARN